MNTATEKITTLFSHSGIFHGDDAVAIAILRELFPDANIVRTRNVAAIKTAVAAGTAIAADVGGENSDRIKDHHQKGFDQCRPNGTKFAAAGLVWDDFGWEYVWRIAREIGVKIVEDEALEIWQKIDTNFICGIDAADNRQFDQVQYLDTEGTEVAMSLFSISNIVSGFNTIPGIDGDLDERFAQAVEMVGGVLRRMTQAAIMSTDAGVSNILADTEVVTPEVLVLPQFTFGWQKWVLAQHPDARVVLFQGVDGNFQAQWVPEDPKSKVLKGSGCPEAWRGLAGPKLTEATGNAQAVFCHNAGFLLVTRTKQAAIELAKTMLTEETA